MTSSVPCGETVSVWPTVYRVVRAVLGLPPLMAVLCLCWHYWQNRRLFSVASKLPTRLPTLPILGHAHYVLYGRAELLFRVIREAKTAMMEGVKTICIWMGPYPVIMVQSAEDIQTVITSSKTSEKSSEYRFLKFALGNGLLIAPGHIQRITRRHVNPLFQPRNLEQLMSVFNESGCHLVRDLSRHVGRGHVDILDHVTTTSLRNVACILLGPELKVNTESKEFQNLFRAVNSIAVIEVSRFIKIWLWSDTVFNFLWKKEIEDIHTSWKKFIEGSRKDLKHKVSLGKGLSDVNDNLLQSDNRGSAASRPLSLPDTYISLMQNYPQFTQQDLQNEMLTLVVTGTDSTKSAISSCLLSLAANPDIQERLYQEIVSVTGAQDNEIKAKDLHNMPYLDQVLKETFRKYAIIPIILRTVKEDIALSECTVPAGATIGVCLLGLHFDPAVFPDPEKFDPDRFSPENAAKLKRYTYLPFSGGSRNCIGKTYAALLVKTVVVHVLKKYRLSTTVDINNLRYNLALAMVSDDGYHLEIHNRS